jgi:hypothetical protein
LRKILAAGMAALTLGGSLATAAEARDYRHRDRDNTGAVVAAGIAGLAIGAALGSSGRNRSYYDGGYGYYDRRYDRGYDRRYYDRRHYGRGYYDRRYYGPPRYGNYDGPRYRYRCRTYSSWDPYYGGYIQRRVCR